MTNPATGNGHDHLQPDGGDAAVAIIGLACRLPGAADPRALWQMLRAGESSITRAPPSRFDDRASRTEAEAWGGFIDEVDGFDTDFFGISPREAAALDPQQRLVLELSWEALEDAGIPAGRLAPARAGVFVGLMANDYADLVATAGVEAIGRHTLTGVGRSLAANRVSRFLGLDGPSLTVDTGQSSSLVAVHLACESLRRQEVGVALAGGVHLILGPLSTALAAEFGALSPDGRCYVFDSRANGYVRGEGGGLVVLKRLDRAVADRDRVYAVIRGTAMNHGTGEAGLTVPSQAAQRRVMLAALEVAGIAPGAVQYVELHGTGTPVGDPVEAAAVGAVYGRGAGVAAPIAVGSIKTNIGHLEGAAGVAGLIKATLCIANRELVASLNFAEPNPAIELPGAGMRVATQCEPWPPDGLAAAAAGVSSFGMGGTNCHAVLSAAPAALRSPPVDDLDVVPWVLSAHSDGALAAGAARLAARVRLDRDLSPRDVGFSLTGRTPLEHRAVVVGADRRRLLAGMDSLVAGVPAVGVVDGRARSPEIAVLFTGQGSQRPGMGQGLYRMFPVFARAFDGVCEHFDRHLGRSLKSLVFARESSAEAHRLDATEFAQCALFALEVALFELVCSLGVRPAFVLGHSIGELVAAHVAGVLSLEDASALVAARGRLMGALPPGGAMYAVPASEHQVRELLDGAAGVELAAVNGPAAVVISGEQSDLDAWAARRPEIPTKRLRVSHAFHSRLMDPMLDAFRKSAEGLSFRAPTLPLVSNVTGRVASAEDLCRAEYWVRHVREPVRFMDGVRCLQAAGATGFLELGPDAVLGRMARACLTAGADGADAPVMSALRANRPEPEALISCLGEAFVGGVDMDWGAVFGGVGRRVALPGYAFERQPYWLAPAGDLRGVGLGEAADPAEPAPAARRPRSGGSLARRLAAVPEDQRDALVLELVRTHAAAVLGHASPDRVRPDQAFTSLGLDSLGAVELRDRLQQATSLRLPATLVFDYPTPTAVAAFLGIQARGETRDPAAVRRRSWADEPVAVVGMACRFPGGVRSAEQLWDLVASGRDAITAFPTDRGWDLQGLVDPDADQPGTSYATRGGFVEGPGDFDAAFFGISPREALAMDPQQRWMLEVAWEALEDAGIDPLSLREADAGVFVGASAGDYGLSNAAEREGFGLTGSSTSVLSGRVAYVLGLQGPAVTVDTACSSSLVALHIASQAVRQGECALALAGGVTVLSGPSMFVEFSRQRGLARDGRCKSFAAAADGTSWSEGAGLLVLEKLADAQRLGHQVVGLLRGSAVNQDGASNGLTAPNGPSQERVIRQALANAGLAGHDVDVVEAHGTGTVLGDPIEARALLATYGQGRQTGPLRLGSLKSNLGHTIAAAGVGGVIKMLMAMRHQRLPATLHVDAPSPHVDWTAGEVKLLTESMPWPSGPRARRAGVSSFGISGTNAHVVLEEGPGLPSAPGLDPGPAAPPGGGGLSVVPWVVSARSDAALAAGVARLAARAREDSAVSAVDIGFSLAGRARMEHRAVAVGTDRGSLLAGLDALTAGEPRVGVARGVARAGTTALVFPGQGSQWAGMAVELARSSPVFSRRLAECEHALDEFVSWSLGDVLRGAPGAPGLARDDVVQPALFAVMVSLAELWRSYGVLPDVVVGHSQGEIAAACVAGALSLPDAARVVALRSQALAQIAGKGGMVSVALPLDRVGPLIEPWAPRIGVAAVNGPSATVISGDDDALDAVLETCHAQDVRARRIAVAYASHSPQVEEIRDRILDALAPVAPRPGDVAFCSAVTGGLMDGGQLDAEYWYRSLREPVRFAQASQGLIEEGVSTFIEVSAHPVLTTALQDLAESTTTESRGVTVVGSLRRDDGGLDRFMSSLGEAFVGGVEVDWRAVFGGVGRRVALPGYAFERQRYWLAPGRSAGDLRGVGLVGAAHPLLGAVVSVADEGWVFSGRLSLATHPWLADHGVLETVLLPGTAFVEVVLRAAAEAGCDVLEELTLEAPLVLPRDGAVQVQVRVAEVQEGGRRAVVVSARGEGDGDGGEWVRHAGGVVSSGGEAAAWAVGDDVWPPVGAEALDVGALYDRLERAGFGYGPAFQGVRAAWRRGTEVFAEVCLGDEQVADASAFGVHPALFDAALHAALVADDGIADPVVRLPFAWSDVRLHGAGATELRVRILVEGEGLRIAARDELGRLVLSVGSLVMAPVKADALDGARASAEPALWGLQWLEIASGPPEAAPDASDRVGVVGESTVLSGDVGTEQFAGLDELGAAIDAGAGVPPVILAGLGMGRGRALPQAAREAAYEALELLQRWLSDGRFADIRLVLVTRGAWAVRPREAPEVSGAAVWGLVRTAQAEHPGRFVLLDIDDSPRSRDAIPAALASDEPQLALRDGTLHAPRLTPPPAEGSLAAVPDGPWRVGVERAGTFEGLALRDSDAARRPLGSHEVRVGMRAAGVNFRDVLVALGTLQGGGTVGHEGAGLVLEVGADVVGLVPGARVLGLMRDAFAPTTVTDRQLVTELPDDWSFVQGAAVPIVFLTAWYAFVDVAQLRAGERVLIHCGAGGVGMAAIQLARHLGAEVFATASPAKWEHLRRQGLADDHIASSRDTKFKGAFLAASGGGMDVVLDALAGELVDASLELLPRGGRFVELGKADVRDAGRIAVAYPGVRYEAFELLDVAAPRIQQMLAEVVRLFARGEFSHLPTMPWDVRRAPAALHYVGRARHVGKVALTIPRAPPGEGLVLVTGGTGGLGRVVARHLVVEHGVRSLVLLSRGGRAAPGAARLEAELEALGARVRVAACDVSDRDAVAQVIESLGERLLGVVHAAGVLDDGVLQVLDRGRVDRVFAGKVDGAIWLDELTRGHEPAFFVMFSSITGTLGSQGQGNYAAANAVLDAVAQRRQAEGLPATSIAWGLWPQATGLTAGLTEADHARLRRQGMLALTDEQGLRLFDAASGFADALLVALPLERRVLREQARAGLLPGMLRGLVRVPVRRPGGGGSLARRLAGVPEDQREALVLELVRTHAAVVLGHASPARVQPDQAFKSLGLDSLGAVELRNRLQHATSLRLPATLVFDHPTPAAVAGFLGTQARGETSIPGDAVGDAFGRLEALVTSAGLSPRDREGIRTRIRALNRRLELEEAPPGAEPALPAAVVSEGSDEELFGLIDRIVPR